MLSAKKKKVFMKMYRLLHTLFGFQRPCLVSETFFSQMVNQVKNSHHKSYFAM